MLIPPIALVGQKVVLSDVLTALYSGPIEAVSQTI